MATTTNKKTKLKDERFVSVKLTNRQYDRLKEDADEQGRSMASQLRMSYFPFSDLKTKH